MVAGGWFEVRRGGDPPSCTPGVRTGQRARRWTISAGDDHWSARDGTPAEAAPAGWTILTVQRDWLLLQ